MLGPPLLLLIMIVLCLSAYYPAIGATVSERESGTLHTLLSTSATVREIVVGKFLAVWASSLLGLASYGIPAGILYHLMRLKHASETLPLHEIPGLILAVVGLSFLVSAISIAFGLLARKQSEAQGMLSVLMLSAVLPSVLASSGEIELGHAAAMVPFVNLAVMSKTLFVHPIGPLNWLLSIGSNVVSGILVMFFGAHVLGNEVRGETALVRWRKGSMGWLREPTADLSFLYFAIVLGLGFYAGIALSGASMAWALILPQLVLFAFAPFALASLLKLDRRSTFRIRWPGGALLLACAPLALSLAFGMTGLLSHFPIPDSMGNEIKKSLGLDGAPPLVVMGLVAVLPAVCEELAFRGLILGGLTRRFAPGLAVAISAALFAFMHLSLIRFLPTFGIGLVLGTLAVRTRSIFPGMVTHALYNLTLVLLDRYTDAGATPVDWGVLAAVWALFGVWAFFLWGKTARATAEATATGGFQAERLAS
jgi:membrane protease YdiL (CAAX protease family)